MRNITDCISPAERVYAEKGVNPAGLRGASLLRQLPDSCQPTHVGFRHGSEQAQEQRAVHMQPVTKALVYPALAYRYGVKERRQVLCPVLWLCDGFLPAAKATVR